MTPTGRFGRDAQQFFESVYQETPPWEIGAPQPDLLSLFEDFPPSGPILDAGCGSGDLAIYLARNGHEVAGADVVASAIEQAREKAVSLPEEVRQRLEFVVADASQPSQLGRRFGSVVDSGFLHLFDPQELDRIIPDVREALRPEGRLYLLAFAQEFDIPRSPRAVSAEEIHTRFRPEMGWRVLEVRVGEFRNRIAPVPATVACVERVEQARTDW